MTKEQFKREQMYQIILVIVQAMQSNGILTTEEVIAVETKLRAKYSPLLADLYPLKTAESP